MAAGRRKLPFTTTSSSVLLSKREESTVLAPKMCMLDVYSHERRFYATPDSVSRDSVDAVRRRRYWKLIDTNLHSEVKIR